MGNPSDCDDIIKASAAEKKRRHVQLLSPKCDLLIDP